MPTTQEIETIHKISLIEGDDAEKDGSNFVGYAARVKNAEEVNAAYTKVRQLHLEATHVVCTYKIPGRDVIRSKGMVDDKEHGAGRQLLNMVKEASEQNLALFAVRYYGGKHLGPQRFDYLNQVASSALEELHQIEGDTSSSESEQEETEEPDPENEFSLDQAADHDESDIRL